MKSFEWQAGPVGGAPEPPFGPMQPLPQQFRLERAVNGTVTGANAGWRHWRGGRWAGRYPHLGDQRFEFVLVIPPGMAGPRGFELQVRLDPWVGSVRCHTPSFDNAFVMREVSAPGAAPSRIWWATKSVGMMAVNPDGVSGTFDRFYLRDAGAPRDPRGFVILNGAWRAA